MGAFKMGTPLRLFASLAAAVVILLGGCQNTGPQSQSSEQSSNWPNYGIGEAATQAEITPLDISISPDGHELPPGSGTAAQGFVIYAQKCVVCHGVPGTRSIAPVLFKLDNPEKGRPAPNVMALTAPYATVIWDYIHRGMPLGGEGTLTPDEVYALTALLLAKNGVIPQDEAMDQQSLPQVKMPNPNYQLAGWAPGKPRPSPGNQ